MKKILYFTVALLACGLLKTAQAQDTGFIDTFSDWSAFAVTEEGARVCYLGSEPQKSEGNYKKRGTVLFLVTHRPKDKSLNVVNFQAGYDFKEGSEVTVLIGGQSYALFTHAGDAWAKDTKTDSAIVQSMIRGSQMILKGTSARGTPTTDTFSLKGFTAAYKAAGKACKL